MDVPHGTLADRMKDFFYSSIETTLRRLARGETTARALTDAVLDRIAQYNGPLNALSAVVADQARADAERIDQGRQSGHQAIGPLAGLPLAIKEIIDTTPAPCSAGLPFLRDYRPTQDARVVKRLRQAGAVIVGVTTSDPGAFGVRTDATTHPQAPERSVGGSSGGSAAAVAAGFAWGALGTDTGGSVRIPAACCLTTSLRPTRGRVPLDGVRPLAWSLDHVGPMTRRVEDIAVLQRCLDPDFDASRSDLMPARARIGVDHAFFSEADDVVREAMEDALATCRHLGCEIVPVRLPAPADTSHMHGVLLLGDSAAYYEQAGFADHPDLPELPRTIIQAARRRTAIQYARAAQQRREARRQVDALFDQVDLLLAPTLPVLTPLRTETTITLAGQTMDYTLGLIRYTHLFNHTGNPVVALPARVLGPGLGVGIQVVARHHRDADAVAFAGQLEAALALSIDWALRSAG